MSYIDVKIENSLMIVNATGELTADEVISVVNEHYPSGVFKDVIWDLTHGTLQKISREGFAAIARATKKSLAGGARQGGKTAYVADKASEYGLMRMYTFIADMEGVPVDYHVFNTVQEARYWIENN